MSKNEIYCVFCKTGYEKETEETLREKGFTIITSMTERIVVKDGKNIRTLRPLLSGYVLFEHTSEPIWKEVCKEKTIFRPLRYSDTTTALRGSDLAFVRWLQNKGGILKTSTAIAEGNRIKIVDGPLKEYEGRIKKINKRRKCAEVELSTETLISRIWLSYELIETINDAP